jgi:putative hemolysin
MFAWELLIIALLIGLNGFFAMSELALVSSRRGRLQHLAEEGSRGAARALRLSEEPTNFLSTVQIGITLIGIFAGAYSGATLAEPLAIILKDFPLFATHAEGIAFAIVVILLTYASLVIGELVPKRIALNHAERIAAFVAFPMMLLARAGAPLVWLLRISTELMLRLMGVRPRPQSTVTEEEVKSMIAEGTESGVFERAERDLLESVLRLTDRSVRSIMVPRPDVMWLAADDPASVILDEIRAGGHSRYPVCRNEVDDIVGVVHTRDLLEQQRTTGRIDLVKACKEPIYINETMPIWTVLERFKAAALHMAIVLDEHGSFKGVVTPLDVLGAIAGELPEGRDDEEPGLVQRHDGSWLVDGRTPIDALERHFQLSDMNESRDFTTVAGFMLLHLGHLPVAGEAFEWEGWRFEVVDLDGRRIDKVLMSEISPAADDEADDLPKG